MKIYKKLKSKKGFTLIELLAVIAIIGILVGFLTPALGKARKKASEAKLMNNLKQIGYLISLYRMDKNEKFPTSEDLSDLSPEYVSSNERKELMQIPGGEETDVIQYIKPDNSTADDANILTADFGGRTFSLTKNLNIKKPS